MDLLPAGAGRGPRNDSRSVTPSGTRTCFALRYPNEGFEFAPEAALVRPEREDPCHDRGDDPLRPKLLGQARAVVRVLVLEGGLRDAAEKPATEAGLHQPRP